ncbi:MAG: patatin-like phospholipase family protein [Rudaea sp.]|uniref:patatin-like phospholipase family protein n=1 Tax=Rudaea sp. TaxID=2136325 RepID=UPI0039E50F0A
MKGHDSGFVIRDSAKRRAAKSASVRERVQATGKNAKGAANGKVPSPLESARKYETVALMLQGGGALGSYQCGVYEGLHKAGILPNWFAGISIGAINAAILAGNAPERRLERLHAFWDRISIPAIPFGHQWFEWQEALRQKLPLEKSTLALANVQGALAALLFGQSGFFVPRFPPPYVGVGHIESSTSFYDTAPLKSTLEEFVDFDRINAGDVRFSVGAVNVRSGNFVYFDNFDKPGEPKTKIRAEHVMASGALPPAFAAVEVDGEHYWDGGLVSNTPLDHVLSQTPRRDSLVFQVDLWRAQGVLPRNVMEVAERQKDIQFSSRTRFGTKVVQRRQNLRTTLYALLKEIPTEHITPQMRAELEPWLSDRVYDIIHLIYKTKPFEEQYKDYAFAPSTMAEHWRAGLADMRNTLAHPEFFVPPSRRVGVVTHDVHRHGRGGPRME